MRNLKEINVVQEITFRSSIFRSTKKKCQKTAITFSGIGARKIYNGLHVWECVIIIFILLALKVGNAPKKPKKYFGESGWKMYFLYEVKLWKEFRGNGTLIW